MKKALIILVHAFVAWALCGATVWIGREFMTMERTLVVHAVGAPIFFAAVTYVYTRFFGFTSPLTTAFLFISFVLFMDVFLVAMVIEKSFDMFRSPLGTWIPISLEFLSTWWTGALAGRRSS
ncbi:MAG: hypothetical protein JSV26_05790 [bacterium]|nr:MAG: hypothetical protein JSV26_05790 [bacterium]